MAPTPKSGELQGHKKSQQMVFKNYSFLEDIFFMFLLIFELFFEVFFHQTLSAMADTFERATNDEKMSATLRDFCDYFAEKLELKKE